MRTSRAVSRCAYSGKTPETVRKTRPRLLPVEIGQPAWRWTQAGANRSRRFDEGYSPSLARGRRHGHVRSIQRVFLARIVPLSVKSRGETGTDNAGALRTSRASRAAPTLALLDPIPSTSGARAVRISARKSCPLGKLSSRCPPSLRPNRHVRELLEQEFSHFGSKNRGFPGREGHIMWNFVR